MAALPHRWALQSAPWLRQPLLKLAGGLRSAALMLPLKWQQQGSPVVAAGQEETECLRLLTFLQASGLVVWYGSKCIFGGSPVLVSGMHTCCAQACGLWPGSLSRSQACIFLTPLPLYHSMCPR